MIIRSITIRCTKQVIYEIAKYARWRGDEYLTKKHRNSFAWASEEKRINKTQRGISETPPLFLLIFN